MLGVRAPCAWQQIRMLDPWAGRIPRSRRGEAIPSQPSPRSSRNTSAIGRSRRGKAIRMQPFLDFGVLDTQPLVWRGGSRATLRHVGPAHQESPGPSPGPESPMQTGTSRFASASRGPVVTSQQGSRNFLAMVAARGRRCPQLGNRSTPGVASAQPVL